MMTVECRIAVHLKRGTMSVLEMKIKLASADLHVVP